MNTFDLQDVENIEVESNEDDYYASIQRAINSGLWGLQGSYGRAMMDAIDNGACMLGKEPARDFYGNFIPSRSMVKGGTKGSREFVADSMGEEWASTMEAL